ncbi:tRNA (N(6)-L-threonylcarbamoyladenosine(37)-C(2))-methylthiotransferase MtaB [Anaerocolumna xylanovorans]|uniref:Threonylcarbamoyladenosine tRNA methylthiotransferase MtaB n=1 Tax=Anaerocolumna xylanovorans DSM 12503 TaxID=1121345 RepID=A0A1M7YMX3_9FIRM|nr:tRNA (N(6)-L-threonylcarbamoyladenosine(37)-C(2))-methylthiotransferase MtaB [Anaerocolumna xylanovorans]SHO53989.1 threonylcarbamoyladenosine tRNA methylthiotransferase MtaB [Anaerocolumna xylanovorans DSM 12503]
MEIQKNRDDNAKTAAFLTLGCKVNSYETEGIKKLFEEDGFQVVEFHERADVYVVNTCTVTNIADRKSRQMLHKARKINDNAIVIAVGCYAQAAGEQLKEDEAIDIVVGNNRKKDIIKILKAYIDDNTIDSIIDVSKPLEYEELEILDISEKTRAYIKIQDGCNQFCSYCIIPYARGRVRSRGTESIMKEAKNLVEKGYKEIVLTGIHLSSYGIDFDNINISDNYHLLDLIKELDSLKGLERIRLGSLEPRIVTESFVKELADLRTFCPHFHLSLQSGCDSTLERMNRKYTSGEYYEKCCLIRKYFKNPAITTDVIVGFPGETEEEFKDTTEFLQKVAFSKMHIFKFSPRKGTKAALMAEQVREDKKAERSNALISLGEKMAEEYQKLFIGNKEKLLVEEEVVIDGIKYQVGHNERYLKLAVKSEESLINSILLVTVKEVLNKEIMICESMD